MSKGCLTVGMLKEFLEDIPDDVVVWRADYYYEDMDGVSPVGSSKWDKFFHTGPLPTEEHQRSDGTTYNTCMGGAIFWHMGDRLYVETRYPAGLYYYAPEGGSE